VIRRERSRPCVGPTFCTTTAVRKFRLAGSLPLEREHMFEAAEHTSHLKWEPHPSPNTVDVTTVHAVSRHGSTNPCTPAPLRGSDLPTVPPRGHAAASGDLRSDLLERAARRVAPTFASGRGRDRERKAEAHLEPGGRCAVREEDAPLGAEWPAAHRTHLGQQPHSRHPQPSRKMGAGGHDTDLPIHSDDGTSRNSRMCWS
jgi:hypothetical protein